jgi:hypothetical protein
MMTWRKSSYSSSQENCVEVGYTWRTSSYTSNENCVQIAFPQDTVAIRDSKNTEGPMLALPRPALSALVTTVTQH